MIMKSIQLITIATFALVGSVFADNCTPGLYYCGHTLLSKGNYQAQIDQCLLDNGIEEVDNGESDLFFCVGGANGDIEFVSQCTIGDCVDAGKGKSDYCS